MAIWNWLIKKNTSQHVYLFGCDLPTDQKPIPYQQEQASSPIEPDMRYSTISVQFLVLVSINQQQCDTEVKKQCCSCGVRPTTICWDTQVKEGAVDDHLEGVGSDDKGGCRTERVQMFWESALGNLHIFSRRDLSFKPLILKIFHFSLSPTVSFLRLPMLVQTVVGC